MGVGAAAGDPPPAAPGTPLWGDDGFTFGDLVDLINPLHHVPILSWAYRAITGDDIAPAARALGGGLFGGIAGIAAGVIEAAVETTTGRDAGAHVIALLAGGGHLGPPAFESSGVQVADAKTPARGGIPTLSPGQLDLLTAAFGGGRPAAGDEPHPPGLGSPAPVLNPEQAALLLASVAAPDAGGGANPGAIGAYGHLAATAALHPLFLPLAPPEDDGPPAAGEENRRGHLAMEELDTAAAAEAGDEIRALFGIP